MDTLAKHKKITCRNLSQECKMNGQSVTADNLTSVAVVFPDKTTLHCEVEWKTLINDLNPTSFCNYVYRDAYVQKPYVKLNMNGMTIYYELSLLIRNNCKVYKD